MDKQVKSGKQPEEPPTAAPRVGVGLGLVFAIVLILAVIGARVVQADNSDCFNHVATTYTSVQDTAPSWQTAEMVCCHCYSTKSDGTRFYHGVLEAGFCRSQRGYCEGFAKCFP